MKSDRNWLSLKLLANCFKDGKNTHLGFKYKKLWYCITHNSEQGTLIPKELLDMKVLSNKPEYLKVVVLSKPKVLHGTSMKIHKDILKLKNNN